MIANYNWWKIFNLADWLATGLVSRTLTLEFDSLGQKTLLITNGNYTSVLFDDVFLSLSLNDKNPFEFGGRAIYLDVNEDVWVGIHK